MASKDDLRHAEGHVAEARRLVHRQKGLIIHSGAAGVSMWDAQRILGSKIVEEVPILESHRVGVRFEPHMRPFLIWFFIVGHLKRTSQSEGWRYEYRRFNKQCDRNRN